jgi:hypothetical protein
MKLLFRIIKRGEVALVENGANENKRRKRKY